MRAHVLTGADARMLDAIGVAEVTVDAGQRRCDPGVHQPMCDMSHYVDFDP